MGRKKNNMNDGLSYYQMITPEGLVDLPETEPEKKEEVTSNEKVKSLYSYSGPVKYFDKVVIDCFEATTMAVSLKQATNNITFRAKKKLGLANNAMLILVNKVKELG